MSLSLKSAPRQIAAGVGGSCGERGDNRIGMCVTASWIGEEVRTFWRAEGAFSRGVLGFVWPLDTGMPATGGYGKDQPGSYAPWPSRVRTVDAYIVWARASRRQGAPPLLALVDWRRDSVANGRLEQGQPSSTLGIFKTTN
jgi:hypothetical protein